jgi:hypothetical protein
MIPRSGREWERLACVAEIPAQLVRGVARDGVEAKRQERLEPQGRVRRREFEQLLEQQRALVAWSARVRA